MASASQKTAFLPPGAGAFLKRRGSEILGLALFFLAIARLGFLNNSPNLSR